MFIWRVWKHVSKITKVQQWIWYWPLYDVVQHTHNESFILHKTKIAEVDPVDNYPRRYLTSMKYPEDVAPKCMVSEPRWGSSSCKCTTLDSLRKLLRSTTNSPMTSNTLTDPPPWPTKTILPSCFRCHHHPSPTLPHWLFCTVLPSSTSQTFHFSLPMFCL